MRMMSTEPVHVCDSFDLLGQIKMYLIASRAQFDALIRNEGVKPIKTEKYFTKCSKFCFEVFLRLIKTGLLNQNCNRLKLKI